MASDQNGHEFVIGCVVTGTAGGGRWEVVSVDEKTESAEIRRGDETRSALLADVVVVRKF